MARKTLVLGHRSTPPRSGSVRTARQRLHIQVLGLVIIADDVSPNWRWIPSSPSRYWVPCGPARRQIGFGWPHPLDLVLPAFPPAGGNRLTAHISSYRTMAAVTFAKGDLRL